MDSISKSGLWLSMAGGLRASLIDLTWPLDFGAVWLSATVSYCGALSDLRRVEVDNVVVCSSVLDAVTRVDTLV